MQPIIITSDKTSWALRPQAYLIQRYWPAHPAIIVGGYTPPSFALPDGFSFHVIGAFKDYPVEKWTDGLIRFLWSIDDDLVLLLMDDYWLFRDVDHGAIGDIAQYMASHRDVARFCLCTDRLGAKGITDYARLGHLDVIKDDPNSYAHFSFQASMWRKDSLLLCLQPGETPWDAETRGDARLRDLGALVLGTRQAPMRYTIAVQKGKFTPDGGYQTPTAAMNQDDLTYILDQGWIPE